MANKKIALSEEIAKNIFSATKPSMAKGEDGYVAYDFKKLYPAELGIFIPSEVTRSNYSSAFPRPFDSYFRNMHDEAAYISRLLEVSIRLKFQNDGIECVPGKVVNHGQGNYTVFRFDDLLDPKSKTDLLCRVRADYLEPSDEVAILHMKPVFIGDAEDFMGNLYLYWIAPVSRFLHIGDDVVAAAFAFANAIRFNGGPF